MHPGRGGAELRHASGDDARRRSSTRSATGGDVFAAFLPRASLPLRYRLRFHFADGTAWERDDPYRFLPTLGESTCTSSTKARTAASGRSSARTRVTIDGVAGVALRGLGAERAARERRRRLLRVGRPRLPDAHRSARRASGSCSCPASSPARSTSSRSSRARATLRVKTDPFAFKMEQRPGTASIVEATASYDVERRRVDGARDAARPVPRRRCSSTRCTSARGRACRRRAIASLDLSRDRAAARGARRTRSASRTSSCCR